MQLSEMPNISSPRSLLRIALAVSLTVSLLLLSAYWRAGGGVNDSDDAMRLVLVRDLLSGRGWYDQWIGRLQPPLGVYMHWSRLLDGALAGAIRIMQIFLPLPKAESAVLALWPLAWIVPALICALSAARFLGGSAAILAAAVLFQVNLQAYEQFRPGRIDHHNIQIAMTLIAAACCIARRKRERWALVAGAAAGFGLAIGLEALLFQALIGLAYGVRWARNPAEAKATQSYALALVVSLALCFVLQTPPGRWSLTFCDVLGLNLVACGVVTGLGLLLITTICERASPYGRFAALALVGIVGAGIFFALAPRCIHGPFADADPRIGPVWLDHVREIQSWFSLWRTIPDTAIFTIAAGVLVAAAALIRLVRSFRQPSTEVLLICVLALTAVVMGASAYRMQDYVFWLGFPVLAAEIAAMASCKPRWLFVLALSLACSPILLGSVLDQAFRLSKPASRSSAAAPATPDGCTQSFAYQRLAALPPGLVAAEVDLGPFILLNTAHSALSAPYHRTSWGMLSAHRALAARPGEAERQLRSLDVHYVLDCRAHALDEGSDSLASDLRKGHTPGWLQLLSTPDQILQVYRLR